MTNKSFFKNKRILITHPFLYEINGATNVALELATFLQKLNAKVTVYTNVFEDPIKSYFNDKKIHVDTAWQNPQYHLKDFDYIWINSQTFPVSLLEELKDKTKIKHSPKIIFMHMSAHEYCPDEMPYIYKFEESLSSLSLFVSEEALEVNKAYFDTLPNCINFYRNPSPIEFSQISNSSNSLKKVLVVSNFPNNNLLAIRQPLKNLGITVDYIGLNGDRHELVTPNLLSKYDAVITIGKTVQYCLVSGTPVYIYGDFGGPGWLNNKNFNKAKQKNFSGRGFKTKTPDQIISELTSEYKNVKKYYSDNITSFRKEFSIDNVLPAIFKQASSNNHAITPFPNAAIAAHRSLLKLVEIDFNKWFEAYHNRMLQTKLDNIEKENKDIRKENEILNSRNQELNTIVNSRSVKAWLKINNLLRGHHQEAPEILLVMCVYNEERNMQKFLNYVGKYVNGIVVVDDNSSDNTVKILKNHKKLLSIINTNNPHTDNTYDERQMRENAIKEAKKVAKTSSPFVLCIDPDERPEKRFLKNLRKLAKEYNNKNQVITIHYRELWDDINTWRSDGIWQEKIRPLFFQLSEKMTFSFKHQYHVPWAYDEIVNNQILLDYNIYHLKMVKDSDRENRKNLYNSLDPNAEIQHIGYDYLNDKKGLKLQKIEKNRAYDLKSVPKYYKER